MEFEHYWNAIRNRVCMKCIDSDGYGNCLINPSIDCPLELYFFNVVDVANRVSNDGVNPYIDTVRTRICSGCKYGAATGTCVLRSTVECALDRYLPLIVQVIEETNQSVTQGAVTPSHGIPLS